MKFKTIIAAMMTLVLTAGTFGTVMTAAAANVSSNDEKQSYSFNIASTGNANVKVVDEASGNQISSYKAGQSICIVTNAHEGYKVDKIIARYDDGTTVDNSYDVFEPTMNIKLSFGARPSNMTITVTTVPDNPTASDPTPEPAPTPTWKKGDVNLDGNVDVRDATLVLKHIAKLIILTGQEGINADVNNDGYINAKDATEILKIVAGIA